MIKTIKEKHQFHAQKGKSGKPFCSICSPGYYSNREGSLYCTICPKGHFCDLNDPGKGPIPCPKGTWQAKSGESFCLGCSLGYYSSREGSLSCTICPKGHWCVDPGKRPIPCPKGTHQDKFGRWYCSRCSPGYYSNREGSLYCRACPKGHFCDLNDRGKAPIPCLKGTYQSKFGESFCLGCSLGYYSNREGSLYCTICPKVHWCDESDRGKAPIPCPKGTYQDKFGRWYCSNCSDGYYSTQIGSFHCKICPKGHECDENNKGKVPIPCPKGTQKYESGESFCRNCSLGYYSN